MPLVHDGVRRTYKCDALPPKPSREIKHGCWPCNSEKFSENRNFGRDFRTRVGARRTSSSTYAVDS